MKITVLSTFDIWPAIDGGQTRYASIWPNFSPEHEITILVYDFRQVMSEQRYRIAPHVEVVVAQASQTDRKHFHHVMAQTGLWLHDVLCIQDYGLSPAYLSLLRTHAQSCDVLVASHPYLAAIAFGLAPLRTLKVYESHNVEFDIKERYFRTDAAEPGTLGGYLRQVKDIERLAVQAADHVTAVSEADRRRLVTLYGVSAGKLSVVSNGVRTRLAPALNTEEREAMRARLGFGHAQLGVLVASSYPPNIESYRLTRLMLQEAGFAGIIVLLGAIGDAVSPLWPDVDFEEQAFGYVSEDLKSLMFECADFAPHFVFDGAGTNLKLLDYLGHGVPVIANRFGVRGTTGEDWFWLAEDAGSLQAALLDIARDKRAARLRAERGRAKALGEFDWSALAAGFEAGMRAGFPLPAEG